MASSNTNTNTDTAASATTTFIIRTPANGRNVEVSPVISWEAIEEAAHKTQAFEEHKVAFKAHKKAFEEYKQKMMVVAHHQEMEELRRALWKAQRENEDLVLEREVTEHELRRLRNKLVEKTGREFV